MRCAHRTACRGQRFALPTAPTFDHKLHSLPPRGLVHRDFRIDLYESKPEIFASLRRLRFNQAPPLASPGYVRRAKPAGRCFVFADRIQSATVERGTDIIVAITLAEWPSSDRLIARARVSGSA